MTICDYIKRRVSWAFFAFFGGAAVSVLLPLIGRKQLAALVGLIVGIAAMLAYLSMLFIRCPRCRAFISTSAERAAADPHTMPALPPHLG